VTATAVPPDQLDDRVVVADLDAERADAVALRGEGERGRASYARARSGDDHAASVEIAGHECSVQEVSTRWTRVAPRQHPTSLCR
jgi:hypothetical protein